MCRGSGVLGRRSTLWKPRLNLKSKSLIVLRFPQEGRSRFHPRSSVPATRRNHLRGGGIMFTFLVFAFVFCLRETQTSTASAQVELHVGATRTAVGNIAQVRGSSSLIRLSRVPCSRGEDSPRFHSTKLRPLCSAAAASPLVQANMVLSWPSVPCSFAYPTAPLLLVSWSGISTPCLGGNRRPRQCMLACDDDEACARAPACRRGAEELQHPLSRGDVVRHAASSLVLGSAAVGALGAPVAALDAQRDARTAQPPPPALLLPVMRLRVRVRGHATGAFVID